MDADAIVIGAGAAGLAAARRLARRSARVLLIEARERAGGRVWTLAMPRRVTPAELGAEFVHGPAPESRDLLRAAGSAAVDAGGESWICRHGDLRPDESFIGAGEIFLGARSLARDESVADFLLRFGGDPALREKAVAARAFVEGFEAADPAIASARAIGDEWASGTDARSARPLLGYGPLIERLRAECVASGVAIEFSSAVREIAWRRGEVVVRADAEAGVRTANARTAIVTLPVGVLRRRGEGAVRFDPELPPAKLEALERIEMGHVVKVALAFQTAFWEDAGDGRFRDAGFFHCDEWTFPTYWTQLPVRGELIVAWAGGPKAGALRGVAEADLIERAAKGFGMAIGEPRLTAAELVGGMTHDWSSDPFARGAYSYVAVGGGGGARAALGAPLDGTIFFAGEATSTDGEGGTVNGALRSGERAADEAAASLA